jgi:hypothetical protein
VEETVEDLVKKIQGGAFHDVADPAFHNIRWLDLLEEVKSKFVYPGSVLNFNPQQLKDVRAAVSQQRSAIPCA